MSEKYFTASKFVNGFTLAEVLITLVIIGVVAAMTIPTLINNTKKQEFVAGLKKANSVLSQSILKIGQNNGYPVGDYSFLDGADFIEEFSKVVSVTKKCDNFSACSGKNLSGENAYKHMTGSNASVSNGKTLITSDGQIFSYYPNPGTVYGISSEDKDACIGRIFVDINGHKNPNMLGYDAFAFYLVDKKGIVPAGSDSTENCSVSATYPGWGCAAKVLKENAINY